MPTQNKIPIRAIVIPLAVDLISSPLIGIIIGLTLALIVIKQGTPREEIDIMLNNPHNLQLILWPTIISACLIKAGCGYLCAKISKSNSYRFVSIYVFLVLIIANAFNPLKTTLQTYNMLQIILTIFAAYAGAWYFIRKNA